LFVRLQSLFEYEPQIARSIKGRDTLTRQVKHFSPFFELALVLVRLDHVALFIEKRGSQHHVNG
jgi:hypothetical protein